MLNVCGVTYTHSVNYGTCLQAYALQTAIERERIGGERCSYQLIPIGKSPDYAAKKGKKWKIVIKKKLRNHYRIPYTTFEDKYMKYTMVYRISELDQLNEQKDAFVCGSDVVWNPEYNRGMDAFYLSFARKYAFSYAASFGKSNIPETDYPEIGKKLDKLKRISVREQKSRDIALQCVNKTVDIVLDPVLLLSQEEWNQIAEKDNRKGKYIFVYTVGNHATMREFAFQLSRQTKYKIVWSGGNVKADAKLKMLQTYTPMRWLQLIRDAEYVVTDSFHGTAFSALFHKNVFTVVRGKVDEGFNIRMNDFLTSIGLPDRIFNSVPEVINCKMPDYSRVDKKLESMKASSLAYLHENLEAANQEKLASIKKE